MNRDGWFPVDKAIGRSHQLHLTYCDCLVDRDVPICCASSCRCDWAEKFTLPVLDELVGPTKLDFA